MPDREIRYPCPVCLGVKMEKVRIGGSDLVLDHCRRCGGIWFEYGEVQKLRRIARDDGLARLAPIASPPPTPCHGCRAPIRRTDPSCPVCGWAQTLPCPHCERGMRVEAHEGLTLDVCTGCRGVWFDRAELGAVWRLRPPGRPPRARGAVSGGAETAGWILADALVYTPELLFHGAAATARAAGASVDALTVAPEAAGGVLDAAGDAAASVFGVVVEVLASLFD